MSSHILSKSYKASGSQNKVIVKVACFDSGKGTYKFTKGSKVIDHHLHFTQLNSETNWPANAK